MAFQLFPRQIVSIFGTGSELYFEFASKYFRIYFLLLYGSAVQPIVATFFNSIGRPTRGITLSLSRQLLFLTPAMLILPLFFGIDGVLYAGPVSDGLARLFYYWQGSLSRCRTKAEYKGRIGVRLFVCLTDNLCFDRPAPMW